MFAFKSELDAWVAQRSGRAPAPPASSCKLRSRWIWLAAVGLLVVPAVAWLIWAGRSPSANVATPQALTNHPGPELEPRLSG